MLPFHPQPVQQHPQHGTMSPEYVQYMYQQNAFAGRPAAPPPPYDFQPSHMRASRSQPARARRRSYSDSGTSDSDAAEAISARILGSSDDPRELKSIVKSTRDLRKHKTAAAAPTIAPQYGYRRISSEVPLRRSDPRKPIPKKSKKPSKLSRSVTPPAVPAMRYDEEIPAAADQDYFNEEDDEQSPVRDRRKRKSAESKQRRRRSSASEPRHRPNLVTSVTTHTALVPVSRTVSRTASAKRETQKDLLGEKIQTWWNPSSVVTGKRQRLPVLDWRKGERYNRAPDGTIIGKEGFENLVFDDTAVKRFAGKPKRTVDAEGVSEKRRRRDSVPSTREEKKTSRSGKSSRRESNGSNGDRRRVSNESASRRQSTDSVSRRRSNGSAGRQSNGSSRRMSSVSDTHEDALVLIPASVMPDTDRAAPEVAAEPDVPRPLLNAMDYLVKGKDGVYNLGKFPILHRLSDRQWTDRKEGENFKIACSILTENTFVAEIALDAGGSSATEPELIGPGVALYGRVLHCAPNAIRVQVDGREDERLSEADEFFIGSGCTYVLSNLSRETRAVICLTTFN